MLDFNQEISRIKAEQKKALEASARTRAEREAKESRLAETLSELSGLGFVDLDSAEEEIAALEEQINNKLQDVRELLDNGR